jgi:Ca2+/Na+ antiporter
MYVCSVIFAHSHDQDDANATSLANSTKLEVIEEDTVYSESLHCDDGTKRLLPCGQPTPDPSYSLHVQRFPSVDSVGSTSVSAELTPISLSPQFFKGQFSVPAQKTVIRRSLSPTSTPSTGVTLPQQSASVENSSLANLAELKTSENGLSSMQFTKMDHRTEYNNSKYDSRTLVGNDETKNIFVRCSMSAYTLCANPCGDGRCTFVSMISRAVECTLATIVPPLHSQHYEDELRSDPTHHSLYHSSLHTVGLQLVPLDDDEEPAADNIESPTDDVQITPSGSAVSLPHSASLCRIAVILCVCITYIGICASLILNICSILVGLVNIDSSTVGATLLAIGSEVRRHYF